MHITLSWLRLGDGSPVHGFQIFFSLTIKKQAFRCLQPFQVRLTASIAVGHATDREHVQVVVPTVKGALGIHGRHWFDSDASHSAPSTRQDGARNLNEQKDNQ